MKNVWGEVEAVDSVVGVRREEAGCVGTARGGWLCGYGERRLLCVYGERRLLCVYGERRLEIQYKLSRC